MVENQIRKLTSEPSIFLLIFISLLLIKLTFEKDLGTEIISIYGLMFAGDLALFLLFKESDVRSISGDTAQALLYAGIALVMLFALFQVVNIVFRQSILPIQATQQQLSQNVFQTVFQSFKFSSGGDIDFSKLTSIKYYLFGFLIPIIETRVIARAYGALASLTNINISDFKSSKTWALIILIASLFMYFHLKVRGLNNNIDLAITFLFAVVSLYLVGKFKEIESANYLHIGWNTLGLALGR